MSPSADSAAVQPTWADRDDLRTSFTLAMSAMYKKEVPLYGDLVHIVNEVNSVALSATAGVGDDARNLALKYGDVASTRLDVERHGAIRLGTAEELRTMARVFGVIGLHAVGYYDLSAASLPMHATCFRPRTASSLHRNPFRVFTSVLRPELIRNRAARALADDLLSRRSIFSDELMSLLDAADAQGGRLTESQGVSFVAEALRTFGWHDSAASTYDEYSCLAAEHPVLADMTCFRSAHINHLTPRTLDIAAAQERMKRDGLRVKDRIEGPPARSCPILLRQTSFLAVEEPIKFLPSGDPSSPPVRGSHRARFGEIEERGAAVTPAGRKLYDELLDKAMAAAKAQAGTGPVDAQTMDAAVADVFSREYPDNWNELRKRRLLYCTFQCTRKGAMGRLSEDGDEVWDLEKLIESGYIEAFPITYEDFLPLSAAGIFQSNLGASSSSSDSIEVSPDVEGIEEALGTKLEDPDDLYVEMQRQSLERCASILEVRIDSNL